MRCSLVISLIVLMTSNIAVAIDSNFNGDCIVNLTDFAIFANDWLKETPEISNPNVDLNDDDIVDVVDLAIFTGEWLARESMDAPPAVQNKSFNVVSGESYVFNIVAEDVDPLIYRVESLPEHGDLYDSDNIYITSVPYVLPDTEIKFTADGDYTGPDTFIFSADDDSGWTYPCGGKTTGTASITIIPEPTPPIANNLTVTVYTDQTTALVLSGEDEQYPIPPGKLKYILTSYPSDASLYDPTSGAGKIRTSDIPYTLSSYKNVIWFTADTTGQRIFQFKVNDGGVAPEGGDSELATVTVNVDPFPQDSLSFNGYGIVDFGDNDKYDVSDGWAIDFWIKTRDSFVGLFDKCGEGDGWEIALSSGKPKFYLFDNNNNPVIEVRYPFRVNDGIWHNVGFIYERDGNNVYVSVLVDGETPYTQQFINTYPDFVNDDPLKMGRYYKKMYRGDIDKLRFFSGISGPGNFNGIIHLPNRTESGNEIVLGCGKASDVMYMFSEGTGVTVTDSKMSLTGTSNGTNVVRWTPFNREFIDTAVEYYYSK